MAYNPTHNGSNGFHRVSEWKIKEQICDIGRRIWLKGFCAGDEGSQSYRLGENRILCTPAGSSMGSLKPDDICTVDLQGKQIGGKKACAGEISLHLAIYKTHAEVKAIIHGHPPYASAFAGAGIELPPMKDAKIILDNRGVATFDVDLEQAYSKLESVDAHARISMLARQVGGITHPSEEKDFISRVCGEIGAKGMMARDDGTTAAQQTSPSLPLEQAIGAMAPRQYREEEIEQLVQIITDQIMASV